MSCCWILTLNNKGMMRDERSEKKRRLCEVMARMSSRLVPDASDGCYGFGSLCMELIESRESSGSPRSSRARAGGRG
jgi:hypothetical protein